MSDESPRELAQGLSDAKRHAVAVCLRAGVLTRSNGLWRGQRDDAPIWGAVISDLMRDGILHVERRYKAGRATLTRDGHLVAAHLPDVPFHGTKIQGPISKRSSPNTNSQDALA